MLAAAVLASVIACPSNACTHTPAEITSASTCNHGLAACGMCMEPPIASNAGAELVGPIFDIGCRELPGGFMACRPYDGQPLTLAPVNTELKPYYDELLAHFRANAAGGRIESGNRDDEVPEYATRPNAPIALYLDFDGHTETNTLWTQDFGPITTPPFDLDNNPDDFNDVEIERIEEMILHLFEDLAPYNVNITTVEPDPNADGYVPTTRMSIGGEGRWVPGAGGIALLGSLATQQFPTAFAFSGQLPPEEPGFAKEVAEIIIHEFGHTIGLVHQGLLSPDGNSFLEYHPGNGFWGPIMGAPLNTPLTTWHNGFALVFPNFVQDDIEVFTGAPFNVEEIEDDHGDIQPQASTVEYPDGDDGPFFASGIISSTEDRDLFRFTIQDGDVQIRAIGAMPSRNLDIKVSIVGRRTNQVFDDEFSLNIFDTARGLSAGTYYLVVEAAGTYGWIGQYFIEGQYIPGPSVTNACSGDVNNDGIVDLGDVIDAFGDFGTSGPGDVNNNGKVELDDILSILAAFGTRCPLADEEI